MPELPEVETMAADLRPQLIGRVIRAVYISPKHLKYPTDAGQFVSCVESRAIEGVRRRGKRLIIDLRAADATPSALLIEVRMTGEFYLAAGALARRHKHDRLALALDDGRELRLRDPRGFARVGCYEREADGQLRTDAGDNPLSKLGPEPLLVSPIMLAERFENHRGAIKPLLLDQTVLAGVGNIYADEALWRSEIHPLARANTLTGIQRLALAMAVQETLSEALEHRGSSVRSYRSLGARGAMQDRLAAYGRAGQPCQRCATPMTALRVGGRGTTICAQCQPPPD